MGEENVSTIGTSTEAILQKKGGSSLGIRHVQALLLFFCMAILYMVRVTMSVCIVAMTTSTNSLAPTFDWSAQLQSVILSSFFWGYVILQIPGGELAAKFGGKGPITICLIVNAFTSMAVPTFAIYTGWQGVCACRVLQGLTQGFLFPSSHNILGKWVPPVEKSRIGTLIYTGPQFGTAIGLILSGILADTQWGWPSVFYTMGVILFILAAFWIFLSSKSPEESKQISADELYYIQSSLGNLGQLKKLKSPWKSIVTSIPFWALVIVHCCQNWGYWTLLTEMPTYMNQVLGVDIKANGVLSAMPYICLFLLSFPLGYTSDMAIKKKWVSVSTARKISNTLGHWGPALALIGLSYVPANSVTLAVICLSITVGLNAGHAAGFILVHIDMSPNYAGTLMGISNCFSNFTSLVAPLAVGFILHDETNVSEWRIVFFIAAAIYFLGNLIFVIFGTAETQSWNEPKVIEEDVEKKDKI